MHDEFLGLNLNGRVEPDETTGDERALAAGLSAGIVSFFFSVVLRVLFGTPLIPERVADFIFSVVPIAVVGFGVALLGPYAERFAFAGCVLGYIVVLAFGGRLYARGRMLGLASGLAFGAGVWAVASLTVVPLIGGGLFGLAWWPSPWASVATLLASGLVYGASLAALLGAFGRDDRLARRAVSLSDRRVFLRALGVAGSVVVLYEALKSTAAFFGWG
jgi:hypothetical protein